MARYFIPQEDVIAKMPNGTQVIVAHAGQPITEQRAAQLGLLSATVGPSETKEPTPDAVVDAPPAHGPSSRKRA